MTSSAPKSADAKVLSSEPLMLRDARWTKLVLHTYTDPLGKTRTWESAERSTRPATSLIDGVGIIAILQKSTGPELLLQKQFRPPVAKVCIEVPAGLVDAGESAEEAAIRELREETGYIGTVEESLGGGSGILFNDPGFTNTNLRMIHLSIDPSLPANQPENLKPELEENEFIEVFSCPLDKLWSECKRFEGEGYAIDARVGSLAEGIEVGRRYRIGGKGG